MAALKIEGGYRLSGDILPMGARNEALQVICATLLTSEKVIIENVPPILDILELIDLLIAMGVVVERLANDKWVFCAKEINIEYIQSEDYRDRCLRLPGSVMVVGPLLARFGIGYFPRPSINKIAQRRLNTHFAGFEKLGASFNFDTIESTFSVRAERLDGCCLLLDEPSVTGTANIIMAAVLTHGTTTIYNAACEPYIQQLCKMLCRMGAKITGISSNRLIIEGVDSLGGTRHRLLPDMLEVGSFIGMAAINRSELTIKNVSFDNLGIIPTQFAKLGIVCECRDNDIYIPQQEHYDIETFIDGSILNISDGPWPMLTPDLLAVMLVVAIQARGSVLIHQKMFESRLFFVDKLIDMGAKIIICDPHRATVIGHDHNIRLRPSNMTTPDFRAGISLLIAAMSAEGTSIIQNIEQIDRGYYDIDNRLNSIGAKITRINDSLY